MALRLLVPYITLSHTRRIRCTAFLYIHTTPHILSDTVHSELDSTPLATMVIAAGQMDKDQFYFFENVHLKVCVLGSIEFFFQRCLRLSDLVGQTLLRARSSTESSWNLVLGDLVSFKARQG